MLKKEPKGQESQQHFLEHLMGRTAVLPRKDMQEGGRVQGLKTASPLSQSCLDPSTPPPHH